MSTFTIFEKIARREIPARIVHEDDICLAFHDISPQAPVHILIVPRKVIPRISGLEEEDESIAGHLLRVARLIAENLGLSQGFRLVINNGPDACESVPHLHVHLLAGRQMSWPPG